MATNTQERIARVLLDYRTVSGSESRVINSIDRTRGKLRQLSADAKALDVPFGGVTRASETLAQRLRGTTAPAADTAAASLRQMREEAIRAQEAIDTVGGGGGLRNRLRGLSLSTVGREIVGLPSVQLGPVSSNDIGQALRGLGDAGVTFTQIAAAAAPMVAVLAPAAAGIIALNASLSETKRVVDAATVANQRYYELLAQGATTAVIEQQIEAQRRVLQAAKDELAQTEQAFAAGFAGATETFSLNLFGLEIEDLGGRIAYGLGQITNADDALTARADELRTSIFNAEAEVNRLTGSLGSTELAANDTADALQQATREFNELNRAIAVDVDAIIGAIAQADLEAAIENVTNAEEQRIREEERLVEAQEALTEASAESAAKLVQIEQDLIDKTAEIERSRGIDLSEAERDAGLERTKAVEENNEALEELEVDHRERLAKIAKDANRDFANAVGERDALAAYQAQQAAEKATEEENTEYEKRRKEINKRLEDTNRDIDRKLQEQQRTINRRYDEQLRTAQRAAQKAVELENARAQAQLTILTNAYNAQLALTQQWRDKVISLTQDVANAASGIKTGTPPGSENKTGSVSTSVSPTTLGYVPRFATGGRPALNRVVELNDGSGIESALIDGRRFARFTMPTQIFSAEQTRRMMSGGTVIQLNLNGATRRTIDIRSRQQAEKVFGEILTEAGV